jgi:hypothetical protein
LLRTLNLDPFDLKPIFHPIDFAVLKGMTDEESISEIIMHYADKRIQLPFNQSNTRTNTEGSSE